MSVSLSKRGPIGQASSALKDTESSLSQDKYKKLIENSVSTIVQEQHLTTGLFPAATEEHRIAKDHYDDAWVRDLFMVKIALSDPLFLKIFPRDSKVGEKAITSGIKLVRGMLELCASEPWGSAFNQESIVKEDNYGRKYRVLTKEAPPIHLKTSGEQCLWPTQNQPDSWGELLIGLGQDLQQGLYPVDAKQKNTIESIAKYLLRVKVADLEQFSMWEWGRVRHPAPISSAAIVAKGLDMITPHSSPELKGYLMRETYGLKRFIEEIYPVDYTVCYDHKSRTDLATFVAHGLGALEGFSFYRLLKEAKVELGNGQYPGKKRYMGDHYYRADEEAIWPMGALLEAKIFLEKAINSFKNRDYDTGEKFRLRGSAFLEKVTDLQSQYGYIPELLEQRGGKLISNGNDLLWNRALLIQVCARAIIANNIKPAKLN